MNKKTELVRKDIPKIVYFLYAALRVVVFLLLIPVALYTFVICLSLVFATFMPEEDVTLKLVLKCVVSGLIVAVLLALFRKIQRIAFAKVIVSDEEESMIDAIEITEVAKRQILTGISWFLPVTLFGTGVVIDYPAVDSTTIGLLVFSVMILVCAIYAGYTLKSLSRFSWNLSMCLSFVSCLNVPVGSLLGLSSIAALQQTKNHFLKQP